jgi:CubicO group peptidase (beta-lactamase class C family)
VILAAAAAAHAQSNAGTAADSYALTDRIFEEFCLDAHIPGLVYGIVADGRLVHVGTFGVQDLESRHPVTADTSPRAG